MASTNLINSVNASVTNNAFFFLISIVGDSHTFNVVNNIEDVVSNGVTYTAYPFNITMMNQNDSAPKISLSIDNIDRHLTEMIREQLEAPIFTLQMVLSNDLDYVEKTIDFLELTDVTYNAFTITGTLVSSDILSRNFPSEKYTPAAYPGLFY